MSLTCKDLMRPNQVTLSPDDTVITAFKLILEHGMRFLPVVDNTGRYLGVFTSPTLIKLLLPRAMTIELGGKDAHKGLNNLGFFNIGEADFHQSLTDIKDEKVINHLSEKSNIPVVAPDTPIMEGVLLLHQYKRHVILVEPDTDKFVGVLSINAVLQKVFDKEKHIDAK